MKIAEAPQQRAIVGGDFTQRLLFPSIGRVFIPRGKRDIWIGSVDRAGKMLWVRQIGSDGEDRLRDLAVAKDGSLIVVGSFSGTLTLQSPQGEQKKNSAGEIDGFVLRYNAQGELQWSLTVGGPGVDTANAVAIDSANLEVTLCGSFSGKAQFGSKISTSQGGLDIFLLRLDINNAALSEMRAWGGIQDNECQFLTLNAQDLPVMAGRSVGDMQVDNLQLSSKNQIGWIYTEQRAPIGTPSLQSIGITNQTQMDLRALAMDPKGNVYIAGNFKGTLILGQKTLQSSASESDAFWASLAPTGRWRWQVKAGGKA
ncbi:MAG: hypothetical protein AAGJ35_09335, partial [Myxococcota bacterium]